MMQVRRSRQIVFEISSTVPSVLEPSSRIDQTFREFTDGKPGEIKLETSSGIINFPVHYYLVLDIHQFAALDFDFNIWYLFFFIIFTESFLDNIQLCPGVNGSSITLDRIYKPPETIDVDFSCL